MVLHGLANDVGHLVKATVLHFIERVHQAPLNGLQAVFKGGNRPLENNVAGVLQEILAVHAPHPRLYRLNHLCLARKILWSILQKGLVHGVAFLVRHCSGRLYRF